mgnify:CR=1 FL=1
MANEKKNIIAELVEKGKAKGSLTNFDIVEALGDTEYDIEQIEKIYEALENSGIEIDPEVPEDLNDIEKEIEIKNEAENLKSNVYQDFN